MAASSDSLDQLCNSSSAQQLHIWNVVLPIIAAASSPSGLPSTRSQQAAHVEEAHAIGIQFQLHVVLQATHETRPRNNSKSAYQLVVLRTWQQKAEAGTHQRAK